MILSSLSIFAETASPAGLLGSPIIMFAVMGVMFYFLLIRPQQRQKKELQERINSLQAGARVVTNSGIYAIVHTVKEKTVVLKIAESTMVEFDKATVASVIKKEEA
jgi:preprotein translocase subunit YajC